MRNIKGLLLLTCFAALLAGCGPALVAGGAAGGYAVAKDKGAVGKYADDSVVTSAVKANLLAAKDVRSFAIGVTTNHGIVSLTGNVPNHKIRNRIIRVTKHTKGVRGVNASNLTISRR